MHTYSFLLYQLRKPRNKDTLLATSTTSIQKFSNKRSQISLEKWLILRPEAGNIQDETGASWRPETAKKKKKQNNNKTTTPH